MINSSKPYKSLFSSIKGALGFKRFIVFVLFMAFLFTTCNNEPQTNKDHLLPETRTFKALKINNPLILWKKDTIWLNNKLLSGNIQMQYETGEILSNATYKNGLRDGRFLEYFYTGELKTHAIYKDGEVEGWFKSFYPNGEYSELYLRSKGKIIGKHKRWYQNDQLMSYSEYDSGQKVKEVQYDIENNIVKNVIHKNGREYGKPRAKYCGN